MYKVDVYVPVESMENIRNLIGPYCCSKSGNYIHCNSSYKVNANWLALDGANPYSGKIGELEYAEECVLTFRCKECDIDTVIKIIRDNHPYEDAVIDIYELIDK